MKNNIITIVGAGLAGSLMATYLGKKGLKVQVLERRPDMRKAEISAGRSINLALSTRGIYALNEVGILEDMMKIAIPMRGRMMHSIDGELSFQAYGKNENEVINSISRAELNMQLMTAAEKTGNVSFYFNKRCKKVDLINGELTFFDEQSHKIDVIKPEVTLACDGAYSAVRWEMMKSGRFNFSQDYLEHGYKELTIPPDKNGDFQMEPNALHIWPRGSYMLIALPNPDRSFTCTLFQPYEGENSFAQLDSKSKVKTYFQTHFPDTIPFMPNLENEFFENPTGNLVTIRCFPWFVNDKALLLGDAAHAIVPFYGQGMNAAFEDCTVLNECIDKEGTAWQAVFTEFQTLRKVNGDAIAQLALDNFIEMRDKVADPHFLMKKKLEILLEKSYPGEFRSTYAAVTFSRKPYSEALRRGKQQDELLMSFCKSANSLEEINLAAVMTKLNNKSESEFDK